MREFFVGLGEKPFRADQVMKWIYHYCCDDFDEMTDINKVFRNKLKELAEIRAPEVAEEQRSTDGTIKWAITVGGQQVETVYIPEKIAPRCAFRPVLAARWSANSAPRRSKALTAICAFRKLLVRSGARRKLSVLPKSPVSARSPTL